MDGDSGDNDLEIKNLGATGAATDVHMQSKESTETRLRDKKKVIEEHDSADTERNARDSFFGRDPRKSLMPNVSHRTTFHDSFGLGDLDSQVETCSHETGSKWFRSKNRAG